MKLSSLALCAALGIASQAQAAGWFSNFGEDRLPRGVQLGFGIATHTHEQSSDDVTIFDGSGTAFKVFGGYRFNRFLTAEIAYIDGGEPAESYATDPIMRVEEQIHAWQASVIGSLPLGQSAFSAFARLGYLDWKVDERVTLEGEPLPTTFTYDGSDFSWGVGIAAALDNALLRLEYEYTEIDPPDAADFPIDAKSSLISLSVAWIF